MRVQHRYLQEGGYVPPGCKALLIGTFPSVLIREAFGRVRATDVDFFYGSADNNFWKDLSHIYHQPLEFTRTTTAVQQRQSLLQELRLGLSDAIAACYTTGSAQDTALNDIELNYDLINLLDRHPTIDRLYFTSSSGKVNAETLTLRLLKGKERLHKMKIVQQSGPRIRQFQYRDAKGANRVITTVTLISPSPLAEQWGAVTAESRRTQYRQFLPPLPR